MITTTKSSLARSATTALSAWLVLITGNALGQESDVITIPQKNPLLSLALSGDGSKLFGLDVEGHAIVWDIDAQRPIADFPRNERDRKAKAQTLRGVLSEDGSVIAFGDSNAITTFAASTGKPHGPPTKADDEGSITSIAISPDGKLFAAALDEAPQPAGEGREAQSCEGEIRIRDLTNAQSSWRLPATRNRTNKDQEAGTVRAMAFDADSKRLAALTDRLKILTLVEGRDAPEVTSSAEPCRGDEIAWTAKGQDIIVLNGVANAPGLTVDIYNIQTLRRRGQPFHVDLALWNDQTNGQARATKRHLGRWKAALSPRGDRLAVLLETTESDQKEPSHLRLLLFDLRQLKPIGSIDVPVGSSPERNEKNHAGSPFQLAIAANGERAAASDTAGTIRIYDIRRLVLENASRAAESGEFLRPD